ncbi:hypothetical protein EDE04_0012 [Streptomyces sp. 2132.2]|uniref:DUF6207 family protein n=1 Tax=Streptomyces sp. 2132.2 TaxID=2485161 RepID=UPI000FA09B30|nr:DUF6207 family protein [Streptomyces sp. 2132.2]ROQ93628.1 hypothetical protein EDE04_0012 [Streptomyces sp. 2132.2]
MKLIDEQHDEDTVRPVMTTLEERWATSDINPVRGDPREPGVRTRILADAPHPERDDP